MCLIGSRVSLSKYLVHWALNLLDGQVVLVRFFIVHGLELLTLFQHLMHHLGVSDFVNTLDLLLIPFENLGLDVTRHVSKNDV